MAKVTHVYAREILDSRGNPTLEAEVAFDDGSTGRASVPSGASTGTREALELRDGDKGRYLGKGVLQAVENVNKIIAPALLGKNGRDIQSLDQCMLALDGTEGKTKLGANAILGVSMALCRAAANAEKLPLWRFLEELYYEKFVGENSAVPYRGVTIPTPLMNILNGGEHADNNLSIQEFMIVPSGRTFKESLRAGVEVFHNLKKVLHENKMQTNVGDEGGFAPMVESNEQAFEMILEAIARAGYRPGQDVFLALDCAASEFRGKDGVYEMSGAPKPRMSSEELIHYYAELCMKFPIVSIEDGLSEDDWNGWKLLTKELGKKTMLVGDDLFVTNEKILTRGIEEHAANAVLVKINQIGSISETLTTMAMARKAHYNTVVSHRSGETEDAFLADLAVATDAGLVKTGSASRGERMAKYNQLLRIEEALGKEARFNGLQSLGMKF